MHKKQIKRAMALALSAVMALTSSGMTSLAAQFEGELEEGYKLVELHANGGEFQSYVKVTKGSPSEASPSQLKRVASPSEATVFAVYPDMDGDDTWLTEYELNEAAADLNEPDGADPMPVWLTKKDDLSSAIEFTDEGYRITENKTALYAGWFMNADIDSTQIDEGTVTAFGLEGKKLKVTDIPEADRKDKEELQKRLEAANPGAYQNLDADNAIQLNMSVDNYDKGAAMRMELPAEFKETTRDKSVVVIHYSEKRAGAVDIINPEVTYEEDTISSIEFTLEDFSPVIIATVDKLVNVKLENVKGGYAIAYEFSVDDQGKEKKTYLPIGETVKVRAGTELEIYCENAYDAELDKIVIKEDDTSLEFTGDYLYFYTVNAKCDNITITPVFKAFDDSGEGGATDNRRLRIFFRSTSNTDKAGKVTGKLIVRKATKEVAVTNWKLIEGEADNNNDLFSLEPDGTVVSNDTLAIGRYYLDVSFDYDGKTVTTAELDQRIGIRVGSAVYFDMFLGQFADEEEYDPITDYLGNSELFEGGKPFKEVLTETRNGDDFIEPAMFGDYTFAGWYENGKQEIKDNEAMYGSIDAFAGFRNQEGKFYSPKFYSLGSTVNPDDTDKPDDSGNSGSTSHGGGGSSSSRNTGHMYGIWEQDANGWRFKQSNGSYAVNQWGKINNIWFFFGADTYMDTGWIFWNNNWYYLYTGQGSLQGAMQTGWVYDTTFGRWFYLDASGAMVTDWQKINNVWYYFNTVSDGTKGAMFSNQWVGDYFVNSDGAWVEGMTK